MTAIIRRIKKEDLSSHRTVSEWKTLFDSVTTSQNNTFAPLWATANGLDIYNGSYALSALAIMYWLTDSTTYLDYFWAYVNNKQSTAAYCNTLPSTNFTESTYKGWAAGLAPRSPTTYQYPLDESIGWRHVVFMLHIMREKNTHILNEPYATYWQDALSFAEQHMWEKWYSRSVTSNLYRNRTHMASHWACIALYLARLTTSATIKQQCINVWKNIHYAGMSNYTPGWTAANASIMDSMFIATTATDTTRIAPFVWSSKFYPEIGAAWDEATTFKQDTPHAINLYHYLCLAGLRRRIPRQHMLRFASAFARFWQESGGNWYDNVDGTQTNAEGTGTGWISDGGGIIGAWDARILKTMEAHSVGLGWNLYASGALAAARLGIW